MGIDDLPHDREAEARSLRLGGEKRIEDPVAQICRDARAVVGDLDDDHRRRRGPAAGERRILLDGAGRGADRDVAAPVERLERVGDQVVNTCES